MLPSCGHFKNIPCPFYKLALCVRPHCPYKHQKSENDQTRQLFPPLVGETESLFDSKIDLNNILHKSPYDTPVIETQNASYIPTPVDTNSRPPGILKTSNSNLQKASASFVPEYKPTPIARLKEQTTTVVSVKSVKSEYIPEFPIAMRKKKNVEEYDPTVVKCVPKKTVTFVDQTDLGSCDNPVVLLSSDEDDDLDDSENAPKFSDDDIEEITSSPPSTPKQVPDIKTIVIKEEEEIEEVKIDEFSVVDKILVDCKKNEMLLNSYQKPKLLPKSSELSSKTSSLPKQDKSKAVLTQKSEIIREESESSIALKVERDIMSLIDAEMDYGISDAKSKNVNEEKADSVSNSSSKSKSIKSVKSDSSLNSSKEKKNDSVRKESKTEKSEKSKKGHKSGHSHLSDNKEKVKKDSKESDKSKHLKKISSEDKKSSSVEKKSSKHLGESNKEHLDKKSSQKKSSHNQSVKHTEIINSENRKSKSESSNLKKKLKTTISNDKHSTSGKRKSDVSDSDSELHVSKNKHTSESKKLKPDDTYETKVSKIKDSLSEQRKFLAVDQDSDPDINDDLLNEYLSSSESDPDEECRRIFNECYPEDSEPPKQEKEKKEPKSNDSKNAELVILRKKRYAHPAAADLKKPPSKVAKTDMKRPLPPAQVMFNRFAQAQAKYAQPNESKISSMAITKAGPDKKRINFAPNQNLLAAVKNKLNQGNSTLSDFSPLPPTVTKTLKVTKRTAHIPEVAMKPRPIIPSGYGTKVPSNIRQKYLNAFIDEFLKLCSSEVEAYDLALEEEKKVYERSSSKPLYLNVAANALNKVRRQIEDGTQVSGSNNASNKSERKTVSHETVLNGPLAQRRSFSIGRKKEAPEIKSGAALYEHLLTYVLTPEQLKENSYPLPHPTERDRAVIEGIYANRVSYCNDAFKRECCRCHKTYYVNVDGDYVRDEECDFHWGRIWKKRIAGSFESRYSCCQGDAESDGCCVSPGHVFEGSESHALKGFQKTLPRTPPNDNYYGIYALDCEMCYTTAGIELTRITVVDTDSKPVYESFVKPIHQVLDYNTRFSGITEDDLKNVRTTIQDVQAVLMCIFNSKTILIGHSLESDLKALKLFHSTVVDTSVVFPHKNGLPFKRALKTLMAEKLNKIIQNDVGGHDSQEDAVACMELMLWKVKEDIRGNR